MSKKLKVKHVNSKGLKGSLARFIALEDLKKKQNKAHEGTLNQQKLKQKSLAGKPKNRLSQTQKPGLQPFKPDDSLLLVGEGDFSYAESLIKQNYILPQNLIATSYDSEEELKLKYPGVQEKLQLLNEKGVRLLYDIDATDLMKSFKLNTKRGMNTNSKLFNGQLNYIMFNFPHTGRGMKDVDRNIRDHQQLMVGFFKSCNELFKFVNEGKKDDFSGYNLNSSSLYNKILVSVFEGEPYDSWQIKMLARSEGFKVERSGRFDWSIFPEYHHKRTNGIRDTTKPAAERDARMYIFDKSSQGKDKGKDKGKEEDSDDD